MAATGLKMAATGLKMAATGLKMAEIFQNSRILNTQTFVPQLTYKIVKKFIMKLESFGNLGLRHIHIHILVSLCMNITIFHV